MSQNNIENQANAETDENNFNSKSIDYNKSKKYWSEQPATVNGMLGGYDFVSDADV